MSPLVTRRVADSLRLSRSNIIAIWHGGEPLACGLKHFSDLFASFDGVPNVAHMVQTNATLIDEEWCTFFKKNRFHVGVSIDGPFEMNINRVDWGGNPTFRKTMKGIMHLRRAGIRFSVIAVVSEGALGRAKELYNYLVELGCNAFGVNIEERVMQNLGPGSKDRNSDVLKFWKDLFNAWRTRPSVEVREFKNALSWMRAVSATQVDLNEQILDIFPSVAWNGDVVVLSPELLGAKSIHHQNFVVGNVLHATMDEILERAQGFGYVRDFIKGTVKCKEVCQYFSFCGGGCASNKFYELGELGGTETESCRNMKQRVVDAVLQSL